jgi:transposase
LGVDLHKHQFHVCYYEAGQSEHREFKMDALPIFISSLQHSDHVAVEVTGSTRYFVSLIKAHVSKVVVVNPRQFRVIEDSIKKTDHNDAEVLARFLSFDGLLPEVKLPEKSASQRKSFAHTRNKLV